MTHPNGTPFPDSFWKGWYTRDKYSLKSLTEKTMFDEEVATPEVAPEAPQAPEGGFAEHTLEENNVA